MAHAPRGNNYRLSGASAILAELKALTVRPLASLRTIDRVLQRNGLTVPQARLAPLLPRQEYPGPQAQQSNQLHEVDLVGPIYLKGQSQRYYIWACKDAFDGAVCLRLAYSRRMDEVLTFLGEAWKSLGRPAQVQFDNAREIVGWGHAARYLSRVIRLCLRFGVEPVFIPLGEPPFNGSVENFHGWYQPWKTGKLPIPAKQLLTGMVIVPPPATSAEGGVALHARLSSSDQKTDLDRQVMRLAEFPSTQDLRVVEVVKEVGSELKGHRCGLMRLLHNPVATTVVVQHRDRLIRFGLEYVEAALAPPRPDA